MRPRLATNHALNRLWAVLEEVERALHTADSAMLWTQTDGWKVRYRTLTNLEIQFGNFKRDVGYWMSAEADRIQNEAEKVIDNDPFWEYKA